MGCLANSGSDSERGEANMKQRLVLLGGGIDSLGIVTRAMGMGLE
ncbi:hypothetical protein LCGC14_1563830, partial [marine sediment metagenome]